MEKWLKMEITTEAKEKKSVELILPWPPSINHSHGRGKYGQIYSKPCLKKYLEYVPILIKRQAKGTRFKKRVEITKIFCPPDNRRRDEDNYLKALHDSLTISKVIKDDSYRELKYGESDWIDAKKPGYVIINLKEL